MQMLLLTGRVISFVDNDPRRPDFTAMPGEEKSPETARLALNEAVAQLNHENKNRSKKLTHIKILNEWIDAMKKALSSYPSKEEVDKTLDTLSKSEDSQGEENA